MVTLPFIIAWLDSLVVTCTHDNYALICFNQFTIFGICYVVYIKHVWVNRKPFIILIDNTKRQVTNVYTTGTTSLSLAFSTAQFNAVLFQAGELQLDHAILQVSI